jgi:ABC-type phosphate transport system substrate-binding protein
MIMRRRWIVGLSAVVALALLATACSSNSGNGGSTTGGSSSGAASGSVKISGSSTVLPISQLLAQEFSQQNPAVQISVDGPGTTDGFVLFCKGETDINDASRAISDDEKNACQQGGVEYIELPIAYDGLTVMTNPANSAVNCLSEADLYALIGPESKGFKTWADADALDKELGGDGNFPSVPLDIVGPGQESGTWGSFNDLALKAIAETRDSFSQRTSSRQSILAANSRFCCIPKPCVNTRRKTIRKKFRW